MHPADEATLVAGADEGIARSSDSGQSWSWKYLGSKVHELEWNVGETKVVWARQGEKLLRSNDAGESWSAVGSPYATRLAADPTDPATLFLGTFEMGCGSDGYGYFGSVRRSTNAGATWESSIDGPCAPGSAIPALEVDPDDPERVYTAFGEDFWRSETSGAPGSWIDRVRGMHMFPTSHVRVGAGERWYVRSDPARGLFVSSDAGATWLLEPPPPPATGEWPEFFNFDVNASVPGLLYESGVATVVEWVGFWCAVPVPYLARSANAGASWSQPQEGGDFLRLIVSAPSDGQTVYAWGEGKLWRSDDGWQTIQRIGDSFDALGAVVAPFNSLVVFAVVGGRDPVRLTMDGGVSWILRSNGLPSDGVPVRILMDIEVPSHLLVAFRSDGVYESTDFGSTWQALPLRLARFGDESPGSVQAPREAALPQVFDAAWDVSGDDRRVFLTTHVGVFIEGYGYVDDGLTSFRTTSVAYSRAEEKLLVGTAAHGVFALDVPAVGGASARAVVNGAFTPPALALGVAPNPFFDVAEIRFATPSAAGAKLEIFDLTGRKVRALGDGELAAQRGSVLWDGLDERGARVAAGVYFLRLDASGATLVRRVVRLR
jgi:hypothetical protein